MSPEEFERLKEQEKAQLREMKRLREQVGEANRKGRLASALEGIAGALSAGDAERDDLTRRLQTSSAQAEARMEVALEAEAERQKAAEAAAELARFEKEQEAARARSTVERLRAELGSAPATPSSTPEPPSGKTLGRSGDAPPPGSDPPAKTFGRT